MQNISKIIVPVDLQQHTDKLVEYAMGVAGVLNAEVAFVHVVAPLDSYAGVVHPSWDQVEKEMKAHAEKKVADLVADNEGKCGGCSGEVRYGDVVDHILDFAEEAKGSLVIIGTHGRKGLEKVMLGSVASEVVKKAPCPTLVFNPYK